MRADAQRAAAPPASDRAFAIDAAAIALVSCAICTVSEHALAMSAIVAAVVVARSWARARYAASDRPRGARELALFAGATLLGAFNDYNSVVRRRIYDYRVPTLLPRAVTTIPIWMLLYWGLILRFLATLAAWHRLRRVRPRDDVLSVARPRLKLALELALVGITRVAVYRWYLDPLRSWLPFAGAIVLATALFRPDRRDRMLLALFAVAGPAVEALYIKAGDLHHYHLGWLGGVPLWIALWWVLAFIVWDDISARLTRRLAR